MRRAIFLQSKLSNRESWFDTRISYNPAVHRTKQAQFHGAVVQDLNTHPLPPPHEELLKYFQPPKRVLKRARAAIEECKQTFNVKQGACSGLLLVVVTRLKCIPIHSSKEGGKSTQGRARSGK